MQHLPYKPLSAVWLKAAVMGSLWASFEIIVGSMLHNLHLPFSGTILAFTSIFLIVAFSQIWNDKGLVWRAGLICALMKSLSPSAMIIGPMIGILTEAMIIELFIRITGRNLFSYMLAGGLAIVSTLFHQVIRLLILYGFDLVKIFEGLYSFGVRQMQITNLVPVTLLFILLLVYFCSGITAALMGYYTGRKFMRMDGNRAHIDKIPINQEHSHLNIPDRNRYSLVLLFIHLLIMITCLWLINNSRYYVFLPFSLAYLSSCFTWYRNSLRYLKKVTFWAQFMVITLLAAFLLEGYASGDYFSPAGLVIGLKMNLRAFVVMAGFSAISAELKNPLIRSVLYNRGFSNFYQSMSLAFSALPGIISGLQNLKGPDRKRKSLFNYLFQHSLVLLKQFGDDSKKRPPVIIITGNIGQGKTTFSRILAEKLKILGIHVHGFLSEGIQEGGRRIGFDLEDIMSGQQMVLSRVFPQDGWINYGLYYFDPAIFKKGGEILMRGAKGGTQLLLIDEVGPLELVNSGWAPAIQEICNEYNIPMIWTVRKPLVKKIAGKWNVGDVFVFDIGEDTVEEILELIAKMNDK